ncbi:MAG TPA: DinB family protein [Thermomicrobiales bacterium]|nr:DinB family protein [Thermomicrobiales bacterium]
MTADADFQSAEIATCWRYIASSLDRLVGVVQGLDAADLQWRPPAPETNSLAALATHTLGNAEENLLGVLCGRPVRRDRDAEFAASAPSAAELAARWADLRARLETALAALPAAELAREREHPRRGAITGLAVLLVVARHAAEHLGQAALTRDLLRAARGRAS